MSHIRATMIDLLVRQGVPMQVRDADGEMFTVTPGDIEQIMQSCQCSHHEALRGLGDWVIEKIGGE